MSLLDVLRSGIKIADNVTKSLQANVTYERYLSSTQYGTKTYAAPVVLQMIVDERPEEVNTSSGVVVVTRSTLTMLDTDTLMAVTGGNGFNNEDKFTLPDGTSGPTRDLIGFVDAGTGRRIITTVTIG